MPFEPLKGQPVLGLASLAAGPVCSRRLDWGDTQAVLQRSAGQACDMRARPGRPAGN